MREHKIQKAIAKHLKRSFRVVREEVPLLSRCADLIYVDREGSIVSIEIKARYGSWRKALTQARSHRLVVDKAYICLPSRAEVGSDLESALQDSGVGLFLYYDQVSSSRGGLLNLTEEIKPEKTTKQWMPSRTRLEEFLCKHV